MNARKQDSAQGYKIAILGSGAAGMSAAAHAAESGISHLLLESTVNLCNTIHQYQKGKFVMAEPAVLPLRSPLEFKPGSREQILDVWHKGIKDKEVNVRFNIQIDSLQGEKGNYRLTSTKSEVISAEYVVMAMGVQGNLRKLGVVGEDLPQVQYQLDDPGIYEGETIVVIGAGDAA
jgi:thioredoxin reductase